MGRGALAAAGGSARNERGDERMSVLVVFFILWCWFVGNSYMGLAVFLPTEPVTFLIEAFLVIFIIYLFMLNKYGKGDE